MELKELINTIKQRDPAIKSNLEVILYPSLWAMILHRISHKLYNGKYYLMARFISQLSRFLTGIEIHPGAKIGRGLFIDHGIGVVIGETCEIGDNVLIYQGVTLGGTGKDAGKRHPTIGNNVMIGAGVKVLGPIKVGDNSRIGAGSVVLKEVPPGCTVIGVPGHVVERNTQVSLTKDAVSMNQLHFPDPMNIEIHKLYTRIEQLENIISNNKNS